MATKLKRLKRKHKKNKRRRKKTRWKEKVGEKKTVKELILRDDELLHITTAVEGPVGYENSKDYRLSVGSDGRLNVEKRLLLVGDV